MAIKRNIDTDSYLRGAFSCGMGMMLKRQSVFEGSKSAGAFSHADIQQSQSTSYCLFALKREYNDDPDLSLTLHLIRSLWWNNRKLIFRFPDYPTFTDR